MPEPLAPLADLLLSMFSAEELRRFVRWGPEGDVISRELPGATSSAAEQAFATVEALRRHGLLDRSFFDRLEGERPRRRAEVQRVRELFGSIESGAPSPADDGRPVWDFFVSYPRENRDAAEALTSALAEKARVFLDVHSLVPGEPWAEAIADALNRSRIVVVLVSGRESQPHYQREEIHTALVLARRGEQRLRVVPVWLSRQAATSDTVPYGLRGIQGLDAASLGMDEVAARLLEVREKVAIAPRPAS